MAHFEFERPTAFAEGFLPSKYAQPLPWPIGVQEEYDVIWHVRSEDARPDPAPSVEDLPGDQPPGERPSLQRVTAPDVLRWRRHRL